MKKLSVSAIVMCCSWSIVFTANHYVRQGATGDGSDWANAWGQLPAALARGDTYYVADGTYPAYTFDDPAAGGTQYITVKKATSTGHGTDTGWDDSYGDGQAVFPAINFTRSYFEFNGQAGEGQAAVPYGFKIYNDTGPSGEDGANVELTTVDPGVSHLRFKYVDSSRPSRDYKGGTFYAAAGGAANTDILVSHCYFHDLHGVFCYFSDDSDLTFEYTCLVRNKSTAAWHAEAMQCRGVTNLTVKYCWFEDIQGTGVIVSGSGDSRHWEVFGNVFYLFDVGHGFAADNQNGSIGGCRVHHNTIVKGGGICSGIRFFNSAGDNRAYNNLWFDCDGVFHTGVTYDYNYYTASVHGQYSFAPGAHEPPKDGTQLNTSINSDPFVNSAGRDFHLANPLTGYPGLVLEDLYKTDIKGITRGADGVWDRGAYEYSTTNILFPICNFQLPIGPSLPCPIRGRVINGQQLTIDDLRVYNLAGEIVIPHGINRTGIFLVPLDGMLYKTTFLR